MTITVIKKIDNEGYYRDGDGYYYQPVVNGKTLSFIAESEDMALLIGLGVKYDGLNTQFPKMAARMLGIKTEWSV